MTFPIPIHVIQFSNNSFGHNLAQLNAPLIKGVYIPKNSLAEGFMFIQGYQFTQGIGGEFFEEESSGWPVTGKYPEGIQSFLILNIHQVMIEIPQGQTFGLSKKISH